MAQNLKVAMQAIGLCKVKTTHTCKFQYHIRKGEFPKVEFYSCSDFEFDSSEAARGAAHRECIRKGLDPMRVRVYTVRRGTETKPKKEVA